MNEVTKNNLSIELDSTTDIELVWTKNPERKAKVKSEQTIRVQTKWQTWTEAGVETDKSEQKRKWRRTQTEAEQTRTMMPCFLTQKTKTSKTG